MRAFNSNLYLNLNSVLVLLPFLPRHTQKPHCYLLSAVLLGKKNGCFSSLLQTSKVAETRLGLGFHGGPIPSYATTTWRLVTDRKSSRAKSNLDKGGDASPGAVSRRPVRPALPLLIQFRILKKGVSTYAKS